MLALQDAMEDAAPPLPRRYLGASQIRSIQAPRRLGLREGWILAIEEGGIEEEDCSARLLLLR
uniref:Predicted protein n=1 Tax=Hordeum vulgare subsp. vulgare TaxID=112509 RepID=F2D0S9_HORVV|nr:predicted protein [Hordeum vulgare subsp. vulgare]